MYIGDPQIQELVNKNMRNCNIIWFALLGFSLIMAAFGRFAPEFTNIQKGELDEATLKTLYYALILISVLEMGTLFVLKKVLMKPMYRLGNLPMELQAREAYISSLFKFYTQAIAVCSACGVSIAIYGLILIFLGKSFNDVVIFFVLSVMGLFIAKPRIGDIEKVLSQL